MRLVPTNVLNAEVPTLLAADATTLAQVANQNEVHLIVSPFVPSPTLLFAGLTVATFTGYAILKAALGAQQSFVDPLTGNRVVEVVEPLGGWTWISTADTAPPQTVYGICFTSKNGATTFGAALFPVPVVIQNSGDAVVVDSVQLRLAAGYMG